MTFLQIYVIWILKFTINFSNSNVIRHYLVVSSYTSALDMIFFFYVVKYKFLGAYMLVILLKLFNIIFLYLFCFFLPFWLIFIKVFLFYHCKNVVICTQCCIYHIINKIFKRKNHVKETYHKYALILKKK